MAGGQTQKCPVCEGDLSPGSDVCPRCGTDVSTFNLKDGAGGSGGATAGSLDDILASVLDEPVGKPPAKAPEESSLDDLDLDLPDEPPSHPKLELDILEEDILGKEAPKSPKAPRSSEDLTFECPGCGAQVEENATRCPSCGALFAEGESFTCPVCNASVSLDAASCPECGVQFEDDAHPRREPSAVAAGAGAFGREERIPTEGFEPPAPAAPPAPPAGAGAAVRGVMEYYGRRREESPFLVGDVRNLQGALQEQVGAIKNLVNMANRLRLPVDNTQRAIADATKKARSRDLRGAVKLAWDARMVLEQSLALQVAQRLEAMGEELKARRAKEEGFPVAEALVRDGVREVQQGRLNVAFEKLQMAKEDISAGASGQSEAHYALQDAEQFIEDVAELQVDVSEYRSLLAQGREALRVGDWETASQMATGVQRKARDGLQRGIAEEMRRARQVVMELKVRGRDVSGLIPLLKQASASAKERGFSEALRYLQLFKQQVRGPG